MTEKKDKAEDLGSEIARTTCTGDVRDFLLDYLKNDKNPLPWNVRGEAEQAETIERATRAAGALVERVVEIVSADGRRTISATLESFTIKDGITAKIKTTRSDDTLLALNHARGTPLQIVIADDAPYVGELKPVRIEPDQGAIFDETKAGEPDKKPKGKGKGKGKEKG